MNRYQGINSLNGYQNKRPNNLVSQFQDRINNNVPFNNNSMLSSNPAFLGSIKDPQFYNRMSAARMEQMKKVKNINDLGKSKEELMEYVIQPLKIEKSKFDEIEPVYLDRKKNFTEILNEFWKSRNNVGYKNILKNEKTFGKDFKNKEELIVHKVTNLDKIGLNKEFDKLKKLLKRHNKELKSIYTDDKEANFKKEFEYVNKYQYRLKYDPKSFDELKEYYDKEQKKIAREDKKLTDLIDTLLESDVLEEGEKNKFVKQLTDLEHMFEEKSSKSRKNKNEEDSDSEDDEKIHKQLKKELGKDYDKVMKELEDSSSEDEKNNNNKTKKPIKMTISSTKNPEKIKMTIGEVDKDEMEQYKKKKK